MLRRNVGEAAVSTIWLLGDGVTQRHKLRQLHKTFRLLGNIGAVNGTGLRRLSVWHDSRDEW